jgi:hypothetical protein
LTIKLNKIVISIGAEQTQKPSKITRGILKIKKKEHSDVTPDIKKSLEEYKASFRMVKNFENKQWKKVSYLFHVHTVYTDNIFFSNESGWKA